MPPPATTPATNSVDMRKARPIAEGSEADLALARTRSAAPSRCRSSWASRALSLAERSPSADAFDPAPRPSRPSSPLMVNVALWEERAGLGRAPEAGRTIVSASGGVKNEATRSKALRAKKNPWWLFSRGRRGRTRLGVASHRVEQPLGLAEVDR